jgi:hypothetical protein
MPTISARSDRFFFFAVITPFLCAWAGGMFLAPALIVSDTVELYRAQHWPTTTGRIVRSAVQKESTISKGQPAENFWAEIEYEYKVDGKTHRSSRCRCEGEGKFTGPAKPNALAALYPKGKEVTVAYNPRRPDETFLNREISANDLTGLFAVSGFGAIGLLALYALSGLWRDYVFRPKTGGVKVRVEGSRIRARLPRYSPLVAALLVMAVLSLATAVLLSHFWSSRGGVLFAWTVVLCVSAAVYLWRRRRLVSGVDDLVIDGEAGTITLPRTFGRKESYTVRIDEIASVELVDRTSPTLCFCDRELKPAQLARWRSDEKGVAFVIWLGNQITLNSNRSQSR